MLINNVIKPKDTTLNDKLNKLHNLEEIIKNKLNWNWLDENWELIEEIRIFNTYIRVLLTLNNENLLEEIENFVEEKDKEKILDFLNNLKIIYEHNRKNAKIKWIQKAIDNLVNK